MNKKICLILISLVAGGSLALADMKADDENLAAAIHYLVAFVESSECTFIRNDKPHTAKEAAAHMQKKYDHFKDEIKTPEDFIRLSASKSLISGKPYMVKAKTGQLLKSEAWLLEALEAYRQTRHGKANKP